MKARRYILIALAAAIFALPAASQAIGSGAPYQSASESDYYFVVVPVEKVYPHHLGYYVLYRKGGAILGQAYLPIQWFTQSAGKGEIITMPPGIAWPYMVVFYKKGVFDHLRLFVANSYNHPSWGHMSSTINIDDQFSVDTFKFPN